MEYLVVEQDRPQVDVFRRTEKGWTEFQNFVGLEEFVELKSLNISVPMTRIYKMVQFPPPEVHKAELE